MRHARSSTWIAGAALAMTAGALSPARAQPVASSHDAISGDWLIEKPVFALKAADGSAPPLKPAAARTYAERQAARAKGDTAFDSATWCSSLGMPRMMLVNYPFEIMVRPKQVAFLSDWNWWARIVYLPGALDKDATAPPPPGIGPGGPPGAPPGGPPGGPPGAPPGGPPIASGPQEVESTATGFANGHWEGDTLVIASDHFINRTLLDSAGLPHSANLKLTERVRAIGPDRLEDRVRIEDPDTFTRPWETVLTFKRQAEASRSEDVCLDRIKAGEPAVREAGRE